MANFTGRFGTSAAFFVGLALLGLSTFSPSLHAKQVQLGTLGAVFPSGASKTPALMSQRPLPPLTLWQLQHLKREPGLMRESQSRFSPIPLMPATRPPAGSPWQLGPQPPGAPPLSNPLLLTDGSVIALGSGCSGTNTGIWWRLTPDANGSYVNGTWSQIASLPVIKGTQYSPRFFSSAVLPDGRVVVEGGEYNGSNCSDVALSNTLGAIYDPVSNIWTPVAPPIGWSTIGDAQSIVLADGTDMQADCCDASPLSALLDENSLTWTATGSGKVDNFDEEGWTLLPSTSVLTIDHINQCSSTTNGWETYDPNAGTWSPGSPAIPIQLADCTNPAGTPSYEMGPQVLRPDGSVVAFGGTTCNDPSYNNAGPSPSCDNGSYIVTTHTAIYNSSYGTWSAGPDVPAALDNSSNTRNFTLADAPAALEPNGNILFAASPNNETFETPTHFFELAPNNTIAQVTDPTDSAGFTSYQWNLLVLPTGQVMALETDGSNVWIYNPSGSPNPSWAPTVSSVPSYLAPGQTYQIAGTQLNGLSQGAAYGDDVQSATNYPIVVIVNNSTGHRFFARSFGFSTASIAPGAASTAEFTVAANTEFGASTLYVIANGISSAGTAVTIANSYTLSTSETGDGTLTSSPSGISCPGTCDASFAAGSQVNLSAAPAAGWYFAGWGGACTGTGSCAVTMNGAQTAWAQFGQIFYTLDAGVTGSGQVASSPAGINCPGACAASFASGIQVSLAATPANGWRFAGWSGACTGTGGCQISMNASKQVFASFTKNKKRLEVVRSGNGFIRSSPAGISCGAKCRHRFDAETRVRLRATPDQGWAFIGWSGACSGTAICRVRLTKKRRVTATFTEIVGGLN